MRARGLGPTLADRKAWGEMRMNPTDLADVSGTTYTYLMNGVAPAGNWTGLFKPGERVRLRFINGSAMSYFDVRIPGLKMTVVAADGQHVHPVTVDEFRIADGRNLRRDRRADGAGRVHDLRAVDGSHRLRGWHAGGSRGPARASAGLDPRPMLTMADMGHGGMGHDMSAMPAAPPAASACRRRSPIRTPAHDAGAAASAPGSAAATCRPIHMPVTHMGTTMAASGMHAVASAEREGQSARRHADDDADVASSTIRASACGTTAAGC